jgi:hypothetical protein
MHNEQLHDFCSSLSGQRKKNKISQVCGMQGQGERCMQGCSRNTRGKETTWKDLGIRGRIILKWILKNRMGECELD